MNTIYQLTRKEDHAGAHVDMLRSQVQGQINRCIMYYILNYRYKENPVVSLKIFDCKEN